jgi:hypothetical protein
MRLGSELALQIDLAAAAIAVLALVFSIRATARQRRLERETLRLQRDSDIIAWSNACLENLCHAEMLMRPQFASVTASDDYERRRLETLADLSCCIDRGRLYFPNRDADKYGLERERAYQGKRHPVLDRLVWVYDMLSEEIAHSSPADVAGREAVRDRGVKCKREFISGVQSEVDPRRRVEFLHTHR